MGRSMHEPPLCPIRKLETTLPEFQYTQCYFPDFMPY